VQPGGVRSEARTPAFYTRGVGNQITTVRRKVLARAAKMQGKTLHIWTINDPDTAIALWRKGVQGIITDDPGKMIHARNSQKN
jgi:glycerophosphoryl diester phosphodiesterase